MNRHALVIIALTAGIILSAMSSIPYINNIPAELKMFKELQIHSIGIMGYIAILITYLMYWQIPVSGHSLFISSP